jgi:dGTPase
MLTRQDLELRETSELASYAMKSADTLGRAHREEEHRFRSVFQRDRDRIVYSTAFRRLEYKTQVFVNHEGDHYRTRLTHTMEVSQIARTIAKALNLNHDLVEAIALGHDVGHTPFGHAGEETLHKLMKDHGGFEHNLQGLRVVELLERRYPKFPGLNLTWEVRESIVKHRTSYDQPTENQFHPEWQALLEAQAVDAADMIAFNNHDLDDGLRAGLLTDEQLQSVKLWRVAAKAVREEFPKIDAEMSRAQTIRRLIDVEVTDVIETTARELRRGKISSVTDVRNAGERLVRFSAGMERDKAQLERFLRENMYRHYRVARMTEKAGRFVEELFNEYISHPEQLPPRHRGRSNEFGLQRAVCDYIAGMTDRYAQEEYKKLFYPFERV